MSYRITLMFMLSMLLSCNSYRSLKEPKNTKKYIYTELFLPTKLFAKVDFQPKRDSIIVDFYSQLLTSFNEPNLFKYNGTTEAYRLTIDRTFLNYYCIRIIKSEQGLSTTYKKTKGIGGYFLEDLSETKKNNLSEENWREYLKLIDNIDFWNLETDIDTIPDTDGETWLLEATVNGKYHCIMRSNPDKNDGIAKVKELMEGLIGIENP